MLKLKCHILFIFMDNRNSKVLSNKLSLYVSCALRHGLFPCSGTPGSRRRYLC